MTGHTSSFGQATGNGIRLAVEEINAAGGIDSRKLEIHFEDDEGKPELAKKVVQKLIDEKKVEVILGEVASTNSLAAAPVAQAARIPMITPSSTNPRVTEVGDFIFRTCFIDPFQGEAMAKFAFHQLKARRVAILGDATSDYSKGQINDFTETFTKLGGKIVARELYVPSDPDFKGQLAKIRRLGSDAIYLPGYYGQTGQIAREARQMKMKMPLLGGDGWDSPELWKLGGDALENTYITNHFAVDNPAPEVRKFVEKYKAEFNAKPDLLAALAYDSVYVLADAIRRAKTTEGAKLRDAIAQTKDFSGVTGRISRLTLARNAVKPVTILKLNPKAAEFVYHQTVEP
ncbi:MAG TPA: ABC transporter substrate-binding protein [Pyrinomonadaceae bacterium]